MTSTTDIYVSQDLRAFSSLGFCSGTIVVTFDSYTDARHLDRSGFAEHFLHSRQIDAIHIISRDNDWYQYPELPQAAKVVAEITSQYGRVVAYGSSMGGYAAIRFGAMVGATTAVALSPQYSIDPRSVPFETRWTADAARVKFIFERNPHARLRAPRSSSSIPIRPIKHTSNYMRGRPRLSGCARRTADTLALTFCQKSDSCRML
jgi:hypothetical protein